MKKIISISVLLFAAWLVYRVDDAARRKDYFMSALVELTRAEQTLQCGGVEDNHLWRRYPDLRPEEFGVKSFSELDRRYDAACHACDVAKAAKIYHDRMRNDTTAKCRSVTQCLELSRGEKDRWAGAERFMEQNNISLNELNLTAAQVNESKRAFMVVMATQWEKLFADFVRIGHDSKKSGRFVEWFPDKNWGSLFWGNDFLRICTSYYRSAGMLTPEKEMQLEGLAEYADSMGLAFDEGFE